MTQWPDPPEVRFEKKVAKGEGCWEWMGSRHATKGHGFFWLNGRAVYSHRFAYQIWVGQIPDGMLVCHRCDNPPCVRPDHLFVGTIADNNADMRAKGRQERGRRHHFAKPPDETVMRARQLSSEGMSTRQIGKVLGVPGRTVYGWVSGKVRNHEVTE